MAEYSGLYNATNNAPEYTAADLGRFFNLLASGVAYGYENQLEILQGTGLQIKVDSGGLVSKGWFYIQDEAVDGASPKTLSIDAATAGYLRKDYIVVEIDTGAEPSGYLRREVFTEAKDIESNDELPTRGYQKLAEISKTRSVTAKANSLGSYQIDDDYDLGDNISVDASGELYSAKVIKLKYKYSKDQIPQIDVVLNFDTEDMLVTDIQAKHMDYDALVANDDSKAKLLVAEYEVTTAGNITIDGLDIKDDGGKYFVVIDCENTSTGGSLRINDVATSDYHTVAHYSFGTSVSSGSLGTYAYYYKGYALAILNSGSNAERVLVETTISMEKGSPKINSFAGTARSGKQHYFSASAVLMKTQSNITSLTFMALGVGSVIKIYKRG